MATIFTKIINGEIPGTFVFRDDICVAFLSINPIAPGHLLVVPLEEVDEWTDLSPHVIQHLTSIAHKLAQALKTSHPCLRVGLIIAGYEINHCHIHVIPTQSMPDLDFKNAASSVDRDELETSATSIRQAMSTVGLAASA
jgi:diadenosine tetraphosphate (Ap4A) HIT family hydrolase